MQTKDINQDSIHNFVIESKTYDNLEIDVNQSTFAIFDGCDQIFFNIDDARLFVETLDRIYENTEGQLPQWQTIKFSNGNVDFRDFSDYILMSSTSREIKIENDIIPEIVAKFKDYLGV